MSEEYAKALRLYRDGATLWEAALSVGRTGVWLQQRMVAANEPRRRRGAPRGFREATATVVERMKSRRADGWTLREIADEYGISHQAVHQLLKRHEESA